jgi:hypothetical protein
MVDVDVDWILNLSIILKPTTRDSTVVRVKHLAESEQCFAEDCRV